MPTSIVKRLLTCSKESFFLFGPRGTGKSTWLKQSFPKAFWLDLLDQESFRLYSAQPERLREAVLATNKMPIIIDEVQKIPQLLDVVHSLLEEKQGWQFVLTGSSARKLKRSGVNLLAGRALLKHLHPFLAAELGKDFNLDNALQFGMLPLVLASTSPSEALQAYVNLYLREEIQQEGLVRNIGNFSRFLEVVSFSHATILNVSNIARECAISNKIISSYLDVLQDLLLSFSLPVFTKRAKRATIRHEKFYLFDSGVFRTLRAAGPLDAGCEINGAALEGLVLQHLRAWNDYQLSPGSLYYWRTKAGVEVDFIVYSKNIFWAIEVKNSKTIQPKDLRGLNEFCRDYPEAKPILLFRGKERLQKGNILCLPVEEFLLQLGAEATVI